ncbi:MAG: DUF4349 domain-containing protein [Anaerolineae bacterium]|nr:DUF4349 domain-containing protein [Anaerolineae bacterium]
MFKNKLFFRSTMLFAVLLISLAACGAVSKSSSEMVMPEEYPVMDFGEMDGGIGGGAMGLPSMAPMGDVSVNARVDMAAEDAMYIEEAEASGSSMNMQGDERIVIKNADLSVAVADPTESMSTIIAMAEDMGGFVVSSYVYQNRLANGEDVPQANVTVRVPAERLQEALDTIKEGASQVLSENQSGQDVTSQFTDLQSRLRNLEDAEAQLREIMASATKTEDVMMVYRDLNQVRQEIEMIKGQMKYYEQSAALSAISVNLIADAALQPIKIGGWEPKGVAKEAVEDLVRALQSIANFLIRFAIFGLPQLVIFGVFVWVVWKGFKRLRKRSQNGKNQANSES